VTHLLLDSKIMRIAQTLERARIPYAFGGAIALAYYAAPRGTEDIDVNVFLTAEEAGTCWEELERLGIETPAGDRGLHDHQVVLSWEHTPIHVFLSYDPFHESCKARARRVPFADGEIRILSAEDITIFKVIYDRPKDRAEVREVLLCMGERMDVVYTIGWLERALGSEDARVTRFRGAVSELVAAVPPPTTPRTPSGALPERE
jgi:hypothetical protein